MNDLHTRHLTFSKRTDDDHWNWDALDVMQRLRWSLNFVVISNLPEASRHPLPALSQCNLVRGALALVPASLRAAAGCLVVDWKGIQWGRGCDGGWEGWGWRCVACFVVSFSSCAFSPPPSVLPRRFIGEVCSFLWPCCWWPPSLAIYLCSWCSWCSFFLAGGIAGWTWKEQKYYKNTNSLDLDFHILLKWIKNSNFIIFIGRIP